MSLEERFEAVKKNYEEVRSHNEYLKKQLARTISKKRRNLQSTPSSNPSESN